MSPNLINSILLILFVYLDGNLIVFSTWILMPHIKGLWGPLFLQHCRRLDLAFMLHGLSYGASQRYFLSNNLIGFRLLCLWKLFVYVFCWCKTIFTRSQTRTSPFVSSLVISWSITEVSFSSFVYYRNMHECGSHETNRTSKIVQKRFLYIVDVQHIKL